MTWDQWMLLTAVFLAVGGTIMELHRIGEELGNIRQILRYPPKALDEGGQSCEPK